MASHLSEACQPGDGLVSPGGVVAGSCRSLQGASPAPCPALSLGGPSLPALYGLDVIEVRGRGRPLGRPGPPSLPAPPPLLYRSPHSLAAPSLLPAPSSCPEVLLLPLLQLLLCSALPSPVFTPPSPLTLTTPPSSVLVNSLFPNLPSPILTPSPLPTPPSRIPLPIGERGDVSPLPASPSARLRGEGRSPKQLWVELPVRELLEVVDDLLLAGQEGVHLLPVRPADALGPGGDALPDVLRVLLFVVLHEVEQAAKAVVLGALLQLADLEVAAGEDT